MTNYTNPTTTDTRDLSRRQHNFGMRDAKGREHGVCVSTWSAVLDGERRHFHSLQKTRDRVEFGGEAKHEHYDTAELRDHHAARLVEKLYRQREREACAACEPIGARSVEVLTRSGTFQAASPAPQNLPKSETVHKLGDGVLTMPNGDTHAAPVADVAASFGPSGELELKPLTVEGARALLDEGVSEEQAAAERQFKGYRHHARRLVTAELYAGDLRRDEAQAKKSTRPAAVKRAKRLERIRQRLEK